MLPSGRYVVLTWGPLGSRIAILGPSQVPGRERLGLGLEPDLGVDVMDPVRGDEAGAAAELGGAELAARVGVAQLERILRVPPLEVCLDEQRGRADVADLLGVEQEVAA